MNRDKITYIVPRVGGIVTKINKQLGDKVVSGEEIAVIESRELAHLKAEYLKSCTQYEMAEKIFKREENLWNEKVSSEQDYLESKQALTEAQIQKQVAVHNLLAIGLNESYIENLKNESAHLLTQFKIKTPSEGIIIEKNIVLGEMVDTDSIVFVAADLSTIWVDLQVYPKDLKYIKKGQQVVISADSEIPEVNGIVSYVSPIVAPQSRTALIRVLLSNDSGVFRPGLFVNAQVSVSETQAKVVVPKNSIQILEGQKCVFIKDEHGFEPAFIEIGIEDTSGVEILSGLSAGQEYVTKGAFFLKSKIVTSTLDSHAGHGH